MAKTSFEAGDIVTPNGKLYNFDFWTNYTPGIKYIVLSVSIRFHGVFEAEYLDIIDDKGMIRSCSTYNGAWLKI